MAKVRQAFCAFLFVFSSSSLMAKGRPYEALVVTEATTLDQKINNGLFTTGYPSVGLLVAISGNSYSTCTATLIGCQTALTAAHCVCPENASGATCTSPSPANRLLFFQHSGAYAISSISVAPNWSSDSGLGRHDLAILHLGAVVGGVQPLPLNTASKPAAGASVGLVGFGTTTLDPVGIKRVGAGQLSVCADGNPTGLCYLYTEPLGSPGEDSSACGGDSGGPMLTSAGGILSVAGVTSGANGTGAHDCSPPHEEEYSDVFSDRAWIQAQAAGDLGQSTCGGVPSAGSGLAPFAGATDFLDANQTSRTFTVVVPNGTQALKVTLNAESYLANDFNLFVRAGAPPTASVFDCKSDLTATSLEGCTISNPAPGTWYLTAARSSGAGLFQITATSFKTASSPCVRDSQTACLQNDRFEVKANYANSGGSGIGQIMNFGGQRTENVETAFYYFTSATNFEMGVKVLNACIPQFGNKFWVFASGLTDQAWTLTIRDTQTGAIKTYTNSLGHLSTTFADVSAFNCQ